MWPNLINPGCGCCSPGTVSCNTGTFPSTLYMKQHMVGTDVLFTFGHSVGSITYFQSGIQSFTGDIWTSDVQASPTIDEQTARGDICLFTRRWFMICNASVTRLLSYYYLFSDGNRGDGTFTDTGSGPVCNEVADGYPASNSGANTDVFGPSTARTGIRFLSDNNYLLTAAHP